MHGLVGQCKVLHVFRIWPRDIFCIAYNIILHLFIKELGSIPSMSFILLVQIMYSIQSVLLELSPLQVQDSEWQPIQQYP